MPKTEFIDNPPFLIFNLFPGVGGVRVSVGVGSDPVCHMSKPEAGHHRGNQHRHLCVGDGDLQGEGQGAHSQTGENTNGAVNTLYRHYISGLKWP